LNSLQREYSRSLASARNTFGLAGNYTFGNRAKVDIQDMATISPNPTPPPAGVYRRGTLPLISADVLVALGLLIGALAGRRHS
jgi:hypothetical protein